MNVVSFFTVLVIIVSCNNEPKKTLPAVTENDTIQVADTSANSFFPVRDFLISEIRYVDSLPVGLMKFTTRNGKRDSGYIKPAEFHKLAEEFLVRLLDKALFEVSFKESSFYDQSTESSTFTYSPLYDDLQIKRVDVIAKDVNGNNRIHSIYIEKEIEERGTRKIKKLFWRAGRYFQIVTPPDNTGRNESIIKVVWNYWD